jgi:hypothetical protein
VEVKVSGAVYPVRRPSGDVGPTGRVHTGVGGSRAIVGLAEDPALSGVQHPPNPDPFHPVLGEMLRAARERVFGGDAEAEARFTSLVSDNFRQGLVYPWGKAVWRDIRSGRWGLGTNPRDIGETLQADPQRVYEGEGKGVLSIEMLVLSLAAAGQEPGCLPAIRPLRGEMVQSGYIRAIGTARAFRRGKGLGTRVTLDPWDYEVLRLTHLNFDAWYVSRTTQQANYQDVVLGIMREAAGTPTAIPGHLNEVSRNAGRALLARLTGSPADAIAHLHGLLSSTGADPWCSMPPERVR